MDLAVEQEIREIFALAAAAESEKRFKEGMEAFFAEFDRKKRDEKKTKEKEEKEAKEVEEMLATQEQIAAFDQRLDDLDTKTVHCLMENGEALDKLREQLREMTKKELDALGADLEASAPPSVRQKLDAERKPAERGFESRRGALLSDDLGLKADDLPRRSGIAPAPM